MVQQCFDVLYFQPIILLAVSCGCGHLSLHKGKKYIDQKIRKVNLGDLDIAGKITLGNSA
jgi:hypothetical protein